MNFIIRPESELYTVSTLRRIISRGTTAASVDPTGYRDSSGATEGNEEQEEEKE